MGEMLPDQVRLDKTITEPDRHKQILPDPDTNMPARVWRRIREEQIYKDVTPIDLRSAIRADHIRFVCISDTHSKLKPDQDPKHNFWIPPGDVLIHAGDFSMKGGPIEIEQFNDFLGKLKHKKKIVIAGNHDLPFDDKVLNDPFYFGDRMSAIPRYLQSKGIDSMKEILTNAVYLQDSMVTICGISIYGSPWQPKYCDWAFNAERGEDILQKWNLIPENIDVLVTHGPPVGHRDVTKSGINVGCVELLNTVQKRVKPKFHVFGHIHEGYGVSTDGVTTFINAASCTKGYKLYNPPIIFDYPLPPDQSKESLLQNVDIVSFSNQDGIPKVKKPVQVKKLDKERRHYEKEV